VQLFVDNSRINLSSVSPILSRLSDHYAQILTIKNTYAKINKFPLNQINRQRTNYEFSDSTKIKTWKYVNVDKDPNHTFNLFLCILLNIFQASFPVKHKNVKDE